MKKSLIYFCLTLSLIVAGFLTWRFFIDLSLSQIDKQDLLIINTKLNGAFKSNLFFAFIIGTVPVIYGIIENLSKLKSRIQGLIALGIIVSCGLVFWQLRIFQINKQTHQFTDFLTGEVVQNTMSFESLNFGIYLLTGFLIGGIICILIFKLKNKKSFRNSM